MPGRLHRRQARRPRPGTRSGLWAHLATAIDKLQPEWVVIENVRGLLSLTKTRPHCGSPVDGGRRDPDHTFAPWQRPGN